MPKNILKKSEGFQQPKREKYKHGHASTIYLQVVGSGANGAPRSLYVFTEQCRYLFNCGEGTQRLASEHRVKLTMLEHVLITHKSWENVGGLPGALLTLQDSGVPKITIHGPPGVESLYNDTKHFMRFNDLQISYCHYENNGGIFDEGALCIETVPLWPQDLDIISDGSKTLEMDQQTEEIEDMFAHEKKCASSQPSNSSSGNETVNEGKLKESLKCKDLAVAYVCKPVPKPGALLPQRCRELGVPFGPLMGELKSGRDVTLSNGRVVKAAEVTEPPDLGPVFIVVEVPSVSYLSALLTSPALLKHQPNGAVKEDDVPSIVVHFTPPEVIKEPRYTEWITAFPTTTTHIFINENSRCMGSERVHKIQYKLNHIYGNSFPLLHDSKVIAKSHDDSEVIAKCHDRGCDGAVKRLKRDSNVERSDVIVEKANEHMRNGSSAVQLGQNSYQAFSCLTYHIRPHLAIDTSKQIKICPEEFIQECYEIKDFKSIYDGIKAKVEDIKCTVPEALKKQTHPHLLFMGTGSCIPNKTRNTSGAVLNISPTSSMLLDCGEGTYGQLVRFLGTSAADDFLRQLRAVYISHLHADHHIGLIRVVLSRKRAFEKVQRDRRKIPKLLLLAPKGILHYLKSYSANFELIADLIKLIHNDHLIESRNRNEGRTKLLQYCRESLGIKDIATCFVYHCPNAYGVAITLEDGWKVVYSGDTMPCQGLSQIGENCDVLIHEATMEDELKEDAKLKRHSTTSEAIEMGVQMKAKYIILTHFSQRYAKVPLLDRVPENVGVAFDNMLINLSDLPCLSHLYPAYVSIFSEDVDEMLKKRRKIKTRNEMNENAK